MLRFFKNDPTRDEDSADSSRRSRNPSQGPPSPAEWRDVDYRYNADTYYEKTGPQKSRAASMTKNIISVFRRNPSRNSCKAKGETTQPRGFQQLHIQDPPLNQEPSEQFPFAVDSQSQIYLVNTSQQQTVPSTTHRQCSRRNCPSKTHLPQRSSEHQSSQHYQGTTGSSNRTPSKHHDSSKTTGSSHKSPGKRQSCKPCKPSESTKTCPPRIHKFASKSSVHRDSGKAVQKPSDKPLFIRVDGTNLSSRYNPLNLFSKIGSKQATLESKETKKMKPCKCKTENCNCKRVTCAMRDKSVKPQKKSQIAPVHRPILAGQKERSSDLYPHEKSTQPKGSAVKGECGVSATSVRFNEPPKQPSQSPPRHESTARASKSRAPSQSTPKHESTARASKSRAPSQSTPKHGSTTRASKSPTQSQSQSPPGHESTARGSKSRAPSQSPARHESTARGSKSRAPSQSPARHESTARGSKSRAPSQSPARHESTARASKSRAPSQSTPRHESTARASKSRAPSQSTPSQESTTRASKSRAPSQSTPRHESTTRASTSRAPSQSTPRHESTTRASTSRAPSQSTPRHGSTTRASKSRAPSQSPQRHDSTARSHSTTGHTSSIISAILPKGRESAKRLSEKPREPSKQKRYESQAKPPPEIPQRYETPTRQALTRSQPCCDSPVKPPTTETQRYESPGRSLSAGPQRQGLPPTHHSISNHYEPGNTHTPCKKMSSMHSCNSRTCNQMVQKQSQSSPLRPPPSSVRNNKSSLDYIPIWYQHAGRRSSDWLDGGAYYEQKYDPTNQIGAFAPNVDVEQVVKMEKKKRNIKDVTPYSNEELKKSNKKKGRRTTGASTVSSRGGTATDYTVQTFRTSNPVKWSHDTQTEPTHQIRSTTDFNASLGEHGGSFEYVEENCPYSHEPLAQPQPSVYTISSVSSGMATSAFNSQVFRAQQNYKRPCTHKPCASKDNLRKGSDHGCKRKSVNPPVNYNQTCTCRTDNCKCMFKTCTSRDKLRRDTELGSDTRCLNPSLMSACSRGRPSRTIRDSAASGDGIFVRRRSSGGDYTQGCDCKTEDCYCLYVPCASRERAKRKYRRKKKKKERKIFQPKRRKTLDDDKCILCQVDAIEKPFSCCMRTCCITWVWSDREFIRHCGKTLGPLPHYADKPPALKESVVQSWWSRQYLFDEDEDEEVELNSTTLK